MKLWPAALWSTCVSLVASPALAGPPQAPMVGERPAIEHHVDQADVDSGKLKLGDLIKYGEKLFVARFNELDGEGRPGSDGAGVPRVPDEPPFIRTSGPESNACSGCHVQPRPGGAGDMVANVFVLSNTLDPVTFSLSPEFSDERNTVGMMGSGPIEMLAREMSDDLISIRDAAAHEAATSGHSVTKNLMTKGISFGRVTVLPDGKVDGSEIEGVDWDLVVKPFHQKGAVASLREFTTNAMNQHHGMQAVERFGLDTDPDLDGHMNELTVGDLTAITIFQAALDTPTQVLSDIPARRQAALRGEQVFDSIGCTSCHIAELELRSRYFTEPNPYNPPGNLQVGDVPAPFMFDMTRDGLPPRLARSPSGGARVRAFTDLKRHDLNDADFDHFANEQLPQGTLAGSAPPSDFTTMPPPRPTAEFLTRKLWDAGNTDPYGHRGDLTTLTQAIFYHGGEARTSRDAFFASSDGDQAAVIEFLKSLRVLDNPPRSPIGMHPRRPVANR